MSIAEVVNRHGEKYSPYQGNLVNHLPMGQLAYFKLTGDLKGADEFTRTYIQRASINPVQEDFQKSDDIWKCVENREGYEACLALVKEELTLDNWREYTFRILDKLKFGMSSGLFHTLIRTAYAVEGMQEDKEYIHELRRAIAYYITGYKGAGAFEVSIEGERIIHEMENLLNNPNIGRLLKEEKTMGKKLKALYSDPMYNKLGFLVEGEPQEKIRALLDLLVPAYRDTDSIVVLHCITGLHALVVLKDFFEDYSYAIDIMTTCIISHLLTVEELSVREEEVDLVQESWEEIGLLASKSIDVHTIKLAYTAGQMDRMFNKPQLKTIALRRIKKTK
ncbi:hypothetical protein [Gudongella sp. SC589]|uniref:hypothetical protein n=1 Tax=Gudongella sp. SC589 TaxID=3385990 RepID=UPI0039047CCB